MPSLLSPRRTEPTIALHATVPHAQPSSSTVVSGMPLIGWPVAGLVGALATALAGWVLIAGLSVVGWLAADAGSFSGAMRVGTQLWLLTNGAGALLGSTQLTLIPWGATAVFGLLIARFAGFAARQTRGRPLFGVLGVTAVMATSYLVTVIVVGLLVGSPFQAPQRLSTVFAWMVLSAAWGSCRALEYDPTHSWPGWSRAIPRAVLGAQLAMLATGSAALVTSLIVHFNRVLELTEGLRAGVAGGIALLFAQLAFAPNVVVWAASYTLGAGFTVGQGSIVSPGSTQLGLLPSIPLFGALPGAGPGSSAQLWWLAAGVLAGGLAAWLVMRARPAARCDETCLVGGLSGLLAGVVFVALAFAVTGDLGTARLTAVGPRLLPLLVMSATTMGLAGMLVGLLLGLLRRSRP
jgi:hypothetical protein